MSQMMTSEMLLPVNSNACPVTDRHNKNATKSIAATKSKHVINMNTSIYSL